MMEAHQIVPDILDKAPLESARVLYPNGLEMNHGNELTPTQVSQQPDVTWNAEPNSIYTILFTDPDASSRKDPCFREILHWLVVNVHGKDLSSGTTIMPYIGSGPPQGSGLHRYVLMIFKQTGQLPTEQLQNEYPPTARKCFNTRNFISKYGLGDPIAGNFYQAQFDEFVRERRGARLGPAMVSNQVVPDVIDQAPQLTIEVKYGSGKFMNLGAELTPTQVKNQPEMVAWRSEPSCYYTLCLTDPDAPSRADPKFGEFLHWLVVNIPGADLSSGEVLAEYVGSGPPSGTGLHRYVILLYKQPGKIQVDQPKIKCTTMNGRRCFSIKKFAEKFQLGHPIAANFYQAQYDDYVPTVHEQLSRDDQ